MSLNRTQIELLITARNQAQQAFDGLSRQIKTVAGDATGATQSLGGLDTKVKQSGAGATAAGVAFGMLAERMARGLVGAFQSTLAEATKLDSSLIGLSSVANAFGQGADKAKAAAMALAADGLMNVGDAATSLKNLLAAGFGLDQAIVLMNRFKDSAAFGRQGSLQFGEAIRAATEGIKNGNSILVDNAGVTKNLGVMLTEAGLSAMDLGKAASDVNVRMAIYNGIIRETNPMTGDAARLLGTAAGQQARYNAQVVIAQQQIGKVLQPALASLLKTLTPMVGFVGQNAQAFVHLTGALAAVIVPLAAVKLAAASGLTPALLSAVKAVSLMASTMKGGIGGVGDFRAAIQMAGEGAGLTTAKLGKLGSVAAVAASAFIGWEIGKLIDDFTGLSGVVERATIKLMGWSTAAQTAGAKQDTITMALKNGAPAGISYAQAIEYMNRVEAIRMAQFDKSAAAQLKRVDAELALNRVTLDQANAEKALIQAGQQAQAVAANRMKMTDAVAASQKKYRDEVAATGYSEAELLKALQKDENGFKAWAKQVQLSDETLNRLNDRLKGANEAQKKAEDAAKKHSEALATLAAVSRRLSDSEMTRIDNLARQGLAEKEIAELTGIHEAAVRKYLDALKDQKDAEQELADFQRERLEAFVTANQAAAEKIMDAQKARMDFETGQLVDLIQINGEYEDKLTEQRLTGTDLQLFQLKRQYDAEVATLGQRTEKNKAYWDTAKARIDLFYSEAAKNLKGFWSNLLPDALQTLGTLNTAVNGTFAEMLLGAKSFSDGWGDIWQSIKSAATNILNQVLSYFLNNFLKGIMGALQGQKGSISSAFSGLFGGTSSSTVSSLFGGGMVSGAGENWDVTGGYGTGASLSKGGSSWSNASTMGKVAGPAAGALAGGMVGYSTGSKAKGALSGAATGASVGMMAGPIGAAIGAGVGALAGAVGGWLGGKSKERKENAAATQQVKDYEAELLKTYGSLEKIKLVGGEAGEELVAAWGDQSKKGLAHFTTLLDAFKAKVENLDEAVQRYGISWLDLGENYQKSKIDEMVTQLDADLKALTGAGMSTDKALTAMSASYNSLIQAAVKTGQKVPAEMQPVLKQMAELGLLTDQTKKALLGLSTDTTDWTAMEEAAQRYGIELSALGPAYRQSKIDETSSQILADFKMLQAAGGDVNGILKGMSDEISQVVIDSKKFGTEIPADMKPLIEQLAASGQLLDENGQKITDLSTLDFAEPISAGFDRIVAAIEKLSDTLTGDLVDSAEEAAGSITDAMLRIPSTKRVKIVYDEGDWQLAGETPIEGQAAGGVMANRPGLVVFGEGGETEVGGPASFFKRIFESLNVAGGNGSVPPGESSNSVTIGPFYVSGITGASDLKDATEKVMVPLILDTIRLNRRGALTEMKNILGV